MSEQYQYIRRHSRNSNNNKNNKKRTPGILIAITDILIAGVCLIVFALFHHVLPQDAPDPIGTIFRPTATPTTEIIVTPPATTEAYTSTPPTVGTTASEEPTPTPTPYVDLGAFGASFPDKFTTDGSIVQTETSYKSGNINYSITITQANNSTVFVVDIYLKNIDNLRTGLAGNRFGRGGSEKIPAFSRRLNALVAVNGDYCNSTRGGFIVRNGVVHSKGTFNDVCVLYYDGTMECYRKGNIPMDDILAKAPYQIWDFGPALLNNGNAITTRDGFNTSVYPANPRTALGYFEPGHYCFVLVEGRSVESRGVVCLGMNMSQLSTFMHDLGCKAAYNLDGGASSQLYYDGKLQSVPYKYNGADNSLRGLTDLIYIAE